MEYAGVVKLVDTLDLGSSAARCAGSSPVSGSFSNATKEDQTADWPQLI